MSDPAKRDGKDGKDGAAKQNRIGKVRRSQVVGTWGPGAVMDFRTKKGAPVSGALAGLEEWDGASSTPGLAHRQSINEPRLQKALMVDGFRLPPIRRDGDKTTNDLLPVVRFPDWLQCPQCGRIARTGDGWAFDPGDAARKCGTCTTDDESPIHAVPARFIVACEFGHLDDFPWLIWAGCTCSEKPDLRMSTTGLGLAGKRVECRTCKNGQSLEGIFAKDALKIRGFKCRGRQPWLAAANEPHDDPPPRVLQRGASNVYWADTVSALDIPPFSGTQPAEFGKYWSDLIVMDPARWATVIDAFDLPRKTGKPAEVLIAKLKLWKDAIGSIKEGGEGLAYEEYVQFLKAEEEGTLDEGQFRVTRDDVPEQFGPYLAAVGLAQRLREVRAIRAFSRIRPPSGMFKGEAAGKLYVKKQDWLPAVELFGEGIFIRFDVGAIDRWENRPDVIGRFTELKGKIQGDLWKEELFPDYVTPRFLLVHSFAHALILQLSLECGYSSSALRERLYVGTDKEPMAGVLIHTGSPDSEGTLGGLVRQGRRRMLAPTMVRALRRAAWCSQDPLCITNTMTLSSARNLAACHACLLAPETSCQHFNLYLDRATLIGTSENPDLGFFRPLLDAVL